MKEITSFKNTLFQTVLILFTIISTSTCGNNQKTAQAEQLSDTYSEVKFKATEEEKDLDSKFLINAAQINLAEIQLAQLALEKGTIKDVKELGQMMQDTHIQAMHDLTALASEKSIIIPSFPTDDAKNTYKKLSHKSSYDFDTAYCHMTIMTHKDAIILFEKASKKTNDLEIKQWAKETIPIFHTQLNQAISCQNKCEKIK